MIPIPEHIRNMIKDEVEKRHPFVWPLNKHGEEITLLVGQSQPPGSAKHRKQNKDRAKWASFGYSLAVKEIEIFSDVITSHVKEIERLKGLIKQTFKYYQIEDAENAWQQFKTENNL